MLSDLRSRRAVIAGGVAVWSAFTFLSGLVAQLRQLFTCRAAVGIGEAALRARGRVAGGRLLSRRAAAPWPWASSPPASPLGGVLGILLGGQLEAFYGWRVAFMAVAVPGFLLAALVARLTDPTRPPARAHGAVSTGASFEIGALPLFRQLWPLLAGVGDRRRSRPTWLDQRYGADSKLDVAAFAAAVGLGLARNHPPGGSGARRRTTATTRRSAAGISGAFDDIARAVRDRAPHADAGVRVRRRAP